MMEKYGSECSVLLSNQGPFENCHQVIDPTEAFNDCVYDLCAMGGEAKLKDRLMSSYNDDCSQDGGITTPTWREAANITGIYFLNPHC